MTRHVWLNFLAPLLLLAFPIAGQAVAIEVGLARADITPPVGYRMAGYFNERFNNGTIDPLYAKVIVFRQDNQLAAIAMCDLVEMPREVSSKIREEASRVTGIPVKAIAVTATHSHTGPNYTGILRNKFHNDAIAATGKDAAESVDYPALLVEKVVEAIKNAKASAVPAKLESGIAEERRLAFNRRFHMKNGPVRFNPGLRNPQIDHVAGPVDPQVAVLLVRPENGGQPLASLTVHALHLDTVGGTKYSGDYPAILETALQSKFGKGFSSLFGTGTCGDINHVDVTKDKVAKTKEIGETLAGTVLSAIPNLDPLKATTLAVASEKVEVPVQRVTSEDLSSAKALMAKFDPSKIPFLEIVRAVTVLDLAEEFKEPTTTLEVQAFRISPDTAIVFLPGEVFVEHGLAIKKASPFAKTFVIELANDNPSYVPTKKAFVEGSYEVVNSRVASGGGELMVEGAIRILKELAK